MNTIKMFPTVAIPRNKFEIEMALAPKKKETVGGKEIWLSREMAINNNKEIFDVCARKSGDQGLRLRFM
jgi:hypothetical protein